MHNLARNWLTDGNRTSNSDWVLMSKAIKMLEMERQRLRYEILTLFWGTLVLYGYCWLLTLLLFIEGKFYRNLLFA